MSTSDSEHVREFTAGAGQPTPNVPSPMTDEECKFILKMLLDEMLELAATILPAAAAKATLVDMISAAKNLDQETYSDSSADQVRKAADQADALVDCYYYSQNAACKKGINLSAIFHCVHAANMAKRDPDTGQFLKRADGKIIKPKNWQAPDITAEVQRQADQGSFVELATDGNGVVSLRKRLDASAAASTRTEADAVPVAPATKKVKLDDHQRTTAAV